MESGTRIAKWEPLKQFTRDIFVRAGVPPKDAEAEAGAIIWANLHGIDSHGVLRIPWYLDNIEKGIIKKAPDIRILNDTPAIVFLDGDHGLGPAVTLRVVDMVVDKARNTGIGWALIRNLTHQGALGYYSQMIARKGLAGILFACSPPIMAPYGARAPGVHNSPITISVPAKRHEPMTLDMATSVVAGGKLWYYADKNLPIPEGWALDKDGNPTTNPRGFGALLPVGGPKGSGLAILFECLTGIMAGNPQAEPALFERKSTDSSPQQEVKSGNSAHVTPSRPHVQNGVVAAIDIGHFTDLESYKEHIDNLIDGIKSLPKAKGFTEINVPGEIEARTSDERMKNGIPVPEGTVANLKAVADRFGVALPPMSEE